MATVEKYVRKLDFVSSPTNSTFSGALATYNDITFVKKDGTTVSWNGSPVSSTQSVPTVSLTISASDMGFESGIHYIGISKTTMSASSSNIVTRTDGTSATASNGDVVVDSTNYKEWIYTATSSSQKWEELGDENSYLKKTTLREYSIGLGASASISGNVKIGNHSYTPDGTISNTFTGTKQTLNFTAKDNVTLLSNTDNTSWTPTATIDISSSNKMGSVSMVGTNSLSTTLPDAPLTIKADNKDDFYSLTKAPKEPSLTVTYSSANDVNSLTFEWDDGDEGEYTGISVLSATASNKTFTGNTNKNTSVSVGSTTQPTVSASLPTGVTNPTIDLSGLKHTHTISAGSIKSPITLKDTASSITSTFEGTAATLSHTVTQSTVSMDMAGSIDLTKILS